MHDFDKFFRTGRISYNMLKYIPGLAKIGYLGNCIRQKQKQLPLINLIKFNVQLTVNYTTFQNVHLWFLIKIKLAPDNDNDIAAGIITVNNFFAH